MNDKYINIGTEKSCCFVKASLFLINSLKRRPLLYYSVEEAVQCAGNGYFSVGVLVFSQLLNLFNHKTPDERHEVAHELLVKRPSRSQYESIVAEFKVVAANMYETELAKQADASCYEQLLLSEWGVLLEQLHG